MFYRERKRLRLKNFDYTTPGAYFVTICVHQQFRNSNIFGVIHDYKTILNEYGQAVRGCWIDLPNHYHNIELDEYVIMPDHFHGIVKINDFNGDDNNDNVDLNNVEDGFKPSSTLFKSKPFKSKPFKSKPFKSKPFKSKPIETKTSESNLTNSKKHGLPEIIRGFKTFSSRRINELNFTPAFRWQRSYYDIIIRDYNTLYAIRKYIKDNPRNADLC
jgi:REP element-mobilizing transposase RayT